MEIGLCIWKLKSRFYFFGIFILLFGCNSPKKKNIDQLNIDLQKVESSFLICRLGNGYFSNYFRKYASKEQKYSHIGIVSKENDSIYVYHTEASELTGIGYVKKEDINSFLKDIQVFDFFEFSFPDSTKAKILKTVKKYYYKKTPFDLSFNSFDDKELYCTELIATAINNNVIDSNKIIPSLLLNRKKIFSLDDIYSDNNINKIVLSDKSSK